MKANSVINSAFEYDAKKWVISILNTTPRDVIQGHSALVIEGFEKDPVQLHKLKPILIQYDLTSAAEENSGSINTKGYITKIRRYGTTDEDKESGKENKRDYAALNYPARSYRVDAEAAKAMIRSIERDRIRTDQAMENWSRGARGETLLLDEAGQPIEPLRYQKLGKHHPIVALFGSSVHGDNCAGWCIHQLSVAGIGDGTDKPKPAIAAGQCAVL